MQIPFFFAFDSIVRSRSERFMYMFSLLPAKDIDWTEFAYVQFRGKTRNVLAYPSLPVHESMYVELIDLTIRSNT